MEGDITVCGDSNMAVMLQNDRLPCDSLWIPTSSAPLSGDTTETQFFQPLVKEENCDEDFDVCFNPPGKKRRLTVNQVQFLEKNFEVENKLEPERKIQLAKELGLQPRQVAIWFQNRRARYKNKQLEKDYDSLRDSYNRLKSDYDKLLLEKENLKNEVLSLKEKLLTSEKGVVGKIGLLDTMDSGTAEFKNPVISSAMPGKASKSGMVAQYPKQEDASSAKSDVFDSDSPHSFLEPADSSHVFEPDQSDFSQDEEDNLSKNFLRTSSYVIPKLYQDPSPSSCNFEFPVEDQPFWSWTSELSYGSI
ncbi:hypothetical protein Tsubulata_042385 [Turnera subulata]|uniref:Homeobox-leucine zipper protein n=1 Tax=Turnera subulata TaxID=218843 RepID=A0A9Q0J0H1_9ROSI|nr:hypothetical protein Tsubulata_042385 [Turnera subulata]